MGEGKGCGRSAMFPAGGKGIRWPMIQIPLPTVNRISDTSENACTVHVVSQKAQKFNGWKDVIIHNTTKFKDNMQEKIMEYSSKTYLCRHIILIVLLEEEFSITKSLGSPMQTIFTSICATSYLPVHSLTFI